MSSTPVLFPSGTLRHKYDQASKVDSTDAVLSAIAQVSGKLYIDPTLVWTAKYLVSTEAALDADDRLGLTLIVFALLVSISEGSTRVPLAPEGAETDASYLNTLLGRLHDLLQQVARGEGSAEAAIPPNAEQLLSAAKEIAAVRASNPSKLLSNAQLATLLARVDPTARGEELPYRPLLICGPPEQRALTTERMLRKEDALAERLMKVSRKSVDTNVDDGLDEVANYPTYFWNGGDWQEQRLNPAQAQAAQFATRSRLAFVTGGPGTGKTTIIVTILRQLVRMGVKPGDIALAAPTGKAAYRMRESALEQLNSLDKNPRRADGPAPAVPLKDLELQHYLPEARTLHRLLEYSPGRDIFRRNKKNPLEAKVVICDEASMIDLDMMHALVDALGEETRLILVGDADQLPPVGGGQPFRDLIEGAPTHALAADGPAPKNVMSAFTTRLEHSYRMDANDQGGKRILELARAVLACTEANTASVQTHLESMVSAENLNAYLARPEGVAQLEEDAKLDAFLSAWFEHFVVFQEDEMPARAEFERGEDGFDAATTEAIERVFEHHARVRILCLTQVSKTGARAINKTLHKRFFETYSDPDRRPKNAPKFMHLEPVMVTQNNYDLNIFNGDIGLVARVSQNGKEATRKVVFPRSDGGFRVISLAQISGQLELAYATSVHKSQGSEFKHIALVMPPETMSLLSKELLYTAVTRASKSVTLLDPAGLFAQGAATSMVRHTGLPERLEAHG